MLTLTVPARGEGTGWRGDGTGRYPAARAPAQWDIDEGKNILWQAKVGKSQSMPVVAGNKIFVTAEQDMLLAVDRASGKVLWTRDNGYKALPPEVQAPQKRPATSPGCGYSVPTPVSDGKHVYACYATGIVVCFDFDGNRRWIRYVDLPQVTQYGHSASPVLCGGKLLVSIGGLSGLDAQTGQVLWQTPAAKPAYGTPAAARLGDTDVAITPNGDCVRAADGKVLARKIAATKYTSPLVQQGVVYFADSPALAFKLPSQSADSVEFEQLWENEDVEGEFFASPVAHDGILYFASNEGVLYALDALTGKPVFQQELEIRSASGKPGVEAANIYPSLAVAGKHLLVGNDVGETLVLAPGQQYKETARNFLDKGCGASPVADGEILLLRGGDRLYCIGGR